jgi:transcriptional regulator with XRE-family HTH domain
MAFKSALRELRLQDELTQGELANRLGVAKSTVSMWESGERKPSLEMLEAIADFFNVNMARLLDEEETPTPEDERHNEDDKVIDFLRSLPKDRLRGILLSQGAPADVIAELDQQE